VLANHWLISFYSNNPSLKIHSQVWMVGPSRTIRVERQFRLVTNQWLEVLISSVQQHLLKKNSKSPLTRDSDSWWQSTRLILGIMNGCSSKLTVLMFGRLSGISKLEELTSVDKVSGGTVLLKWMKSSITTVIKL